MKAKRSERFRPWDVVTRPDGETFEVDAFCQKPPRTVNGAPLLNVHASDWPVVPVTLNVPPLDCPPPLAINDFLRDMEKMGHE